MPIIARRPVEKQYIKALIHGPAGQGKTRFLGTAQEDERTFPMAFLNFEGGDQTLAGLDVDVYDIADWNDYKEAKRMLSDRHTPYKSVGIDSVTETQVEGLLSLLEKQGISRPDPDQLAQQDWGLILIQMRRFVRDFKFLPMHSFFTALSKDDVVPRIGTVKVPAVQGAFAAELPGIMDVVAYMAIEELPTGPQRVLLLHSNPRFGVKVRTAWDGQVPSEIIDPTVTKLLDALGYGAHSGGTPSPTPVTAPTHRITRRTR